jgi:hypothetical protein
MTNVNEEIQNVNVTISVPVKDIAGLVAINYEELASKVYSEFDLSSIASDVVDEMDSNDLIEKIDMEDLAKNMSDQIDISDYIDTDDVATSAADMVEVDDKVYKLLINYSPNNSCEIGNAATKAMINAIRYDIMSHLYGQDGNNLHVTITSVLKKFIQQELASIEEAKTTFTIGEIIDVLTGINGVNNKISEIVIAFAQAKPQVMRSSEEIIIKAD